MESLGKQIVLLGDMEVHAVIYSDNWITGYARIGKGNKQTFTPVLFHHHTRDFTYDDTVECSVWTINTSITPCTRIDCIVIGVLEVR